MSFFFRIGSFVTLISSFYAILSLRTVPKDANYSLYFRMLGTSPTVWSGEWWKRVHTSLRACGAVSQAQLAESLGAAAGSGRKA